MQCSIRLYTAPSRWPPKQVLVVQKISRLDFERKKHSHLSPEALKDKVTQTCDVEYAAAALFL